MRILTKEIMVDILEHKELTPTEKILMSRAVKVRQNAQAPYSHYWVGCSVLAIGIQHKNILFYFDGCNVENVNWSETVHAEENAISTAVAKLGPCRIMSVAIVGAPENQKVIWPPRKISLKFSIKKVEDVCPSCGHCLQVIAENCFRTTGEYDPGISLLNYQEQSGEISRTTIGDAYPMPFLPSHLGINYIKSKK